MKKSNSLFIDISKLKKLDFTKGKLKREVEKIRKENERLIENTKINVQDLHIRFDI